MHFHQKNDFNVKYFPLTEQNSQHETKYFQRSDIVLLHSAFEESIFETELGECAFVNREYLLIIESGSLKPTN